MTDILVDIVCSIFDTDLSHKFRRRSPNSAVVCSCKLFCIVSKRASLYLLPVYLFLPVILPTRATELFVFLLFPGRESSVSLLLSHTVIFLLLPPPVSIFSLLLLPLFVVLMFVVPVSAAAAPGNFLSSD